MFGLMTNAQVSTPSVNVIEPLRLTVTFHKTTNLIFPYAIKSVDRGSSAILVQKAKGVENILQVKAGKKDFSPTNLSLVTADGAFYSFVLDYAGEPSCLNIRFDKGNMDATAQLTGQHNERELEKHAGIVEALPPFLNVHCKQQRMRLALNGVFLSDTKM